MGVLDAPWRSTDQVRTVRLRHVCELGNRRDTQESREVSLVAREEVSHEVNVEVGHEMGRYERQDLQLRLHHVFARWQDNQLGLVGLGCSIL